VKLLLDEHYPSILAAQLRSLGFDVIAVTETGFVATGGMRGLLDEPLLRRATEEGRALVSENARDLVPIARSLLSRGETHAGVVLTSSRGYMRRKDAVGRLITALAALMKERESLSGEIVWL
jgi:hypothetical protein